MGACCRSSRVSDFPFCTLCVATLNSIFCQIYDFSCSLFLCGRFLFSIPGFNCVFSLSRCLLHQLELGSTFLVSPTVFSAVVYVERMAIGAITMQIVFFDSILWIFLRIFYFGLPSGFSLYFVISWTEYRDRNRYIEARTFPVQFSLV